MAIDPEDTPLKLQKIAAWFVPPDLEDAISVGATPDERAAAHQSFRRRMLRWRVTVSTALIIVLTICAWDHGVPGHFFPNVGMGLAYASDLDKKVAAVDQNTRTQVAAIIQRQKETDAKLDSQAAQLKQLNVSAAEKALKDLQSEICKTTEPILKRRLNQLLEDGMQDYRRLAGEDYRVRSCEVL